MSRSTAFALLIVVCLVSRAVALVVDHNDIDRVSSLPQATMDAIGQQKWLFTHASVGGNMTSGMSALHAANSTRYQLLVSSVAYNSSLQRANNPPAPTVAGRVYECDRGNPGWQSKVTIFGNSVKSGGWHDSAVTVAMDKFCYIDPTASAPTYLSAMADLEANYPNTVFVYTTMPLMTSEDSDNILRNQYNSAVRTYCIEHSRLLFDIADMEACQPNGTVSTFTSGGKVYQKLYSGYSSDGGHLNTTGCQRIAMGWYAVGASIALRNQGDLNADGHVNQADLTLFETCNRGPGVARDASSACQAADFDKDNDVDQSDFGVFQAFYGLR